MAVQSLRDWCLRVVEAVDKYRVCGNGEICRVDSHLLVGLLALNVALTSVNVNNKNSI